MVKSKYLFTAILFETAGALRLSDSSSRTSTGAKHDKGRPRGTGTNSTVAARKLDISKVPGGGTSDSGSGAQVRSGSVTR